MRKTFTLTILSILLSSTFIFAQSKVTRYCEVIAEANSSRTLDEKVILKIVLGKNEGYFSFRDTSIVKQLKKVNELNTTTDLINYMSTNGWEIMNMIPSTAPVSRRNYYFKREFDKSDFQ